jgi:hypothetical protein
MLPICRFCSTFDAEYDADIVFNDAFCSIKTQMSIARGEGVIRATIWRLHTAAIRFKGFTTPGKHVRQNYAGATKRIVS